MADRVIIAAFDNRNAAYNAARDLENLNRDEAIKIKRAAIATKDDKGNLNIPDTKNIGKAWGLLGGGIIGGLLGLLLGPAAAVAGASIGLLGGTVVDVVNLGISEDFLREVGSQIRPNHTVLIAELDEGSTEPVDSVVLRQGGRIFRSDI